MSKRRLNKQQQSRIAENQQGYFVADSKTDTANNEKNPVQCNGRVICHFGQQLDVESLDPSNKGKVVRCHQRSNLPRLVTGDLVLWEEDEDDKGVIIALGERSSVFARPTGSGEIKPIAANIDLVLIVIAPLPEPFMNLIDRYLVAIACLKLKAVLVLNKSDLEIDDFESLDNMLSKYISIGYEVYRVSALTGAGLTELEQRLAGDTTVFVGQSGVGKSSLINTLSHSELTEVGPLSKARAKGTHTTTTSTLFHLPSCDLVDSPGIREFGLGHINSDQLFSGFPEFQEHVGKCKFRDCSHRSEPQCAIREALDRGEILPERLESYFQILNTIES